MSEENLKAVVVNVGQGDSIVFQLPLRRWGLVDCNVAAWRDYAPVEDVCRPYGVSKLDILALSHPDADHYLGMPQWIARFRESLTEFWDSDLRERVSLVELKRETRDGQDLAAVYDWFRERRPHIRHGKLRSHTLLIREGDLDILCLAPNAKAVARVEAAILECVAGRRGTLPSMNAASGVVAMFYGTTCFMLGADATGSSWKMITDVLQTCRSRRVDRTIVKVPHHGSRESNPKHAWEYMRDRMITTHAVVSVAKTNRYGHPHTETIERLLDLGIEIICTSGIEYRKQGGRILERDTYTTVYERSGKYNEHGQNVEIVIPAKGFPTVKTRRFG